MIRIRRLAPILVLFLSLGACNPDSPTGPKPFSIFDIYGLWKVRLDDANCGPAQEFYLDFGPFGITPTADSVSISGSWYLDQKNPDTFKLTGSISRESGLAFFSMDNFDTQIIEGIFVSNKNFAGAYREVDGCINRLRGKFLE